VKSLLRLVKQRIASTTFRVSLARGALDRGRREVARKLFRRFGLNRPA